MFRNTSLRATPVEIYDPPPALVGWTTLIQISFVGPNAHGKALPVDGVDPVLLEALVFPFVLFLGATPLSLGFSPRAVLAIVPGLG